jgi:arylsulfatase A-like enzyme
VIRLRLLALISPLLAMLSSCGVPTRPNLIFILADDLGWSDTTLFGSTAFYETPNLEKLASRGMLFTNAYSASPVCSPTRASILTGLHPARTGITRPASPSSPVRLEEKLTISAPATRRALQAISATRLALEYVTLAEVLRKHRYATGHFGKWHLGKHPFDPLEQGFDVDVPGWAGPGPSGGHLAPWGPSADWKLEGRPGDHLEDRMVDEAIAFIEANKDRAFYLNYWSFSVHSPWEAKQDLIEKYRRKVDPNAAQRNPLNAAMIQSLDEAVGRLIEAVDDLGIGDRTIIVFTSDNGGIDWLTNRMRRKFGMNAPPTSNAPLRGGKGTLYEGGTRVPAIVVWPRRMEASRSDALLSSEDWYPTLLEMIGLRYETKLDGVSQVPALLGRGKPRTEVFGFFPHFSPVAGGIPGTSVRRGDWKLIRLHCDNPDQSDRFELYDLANDPGETTNLAGQHPDKVKELNALITGFLRDSHAVVPEPNPAYRRPTTTEPSLHPSGDSA